MSERLTADQILTVAECAALLSMPASTVADLCRRGEIKSLKLGRRRLILRADVAALFAKGGDDVAV
jgi:excisionase family DNA binding protein